MEVMEQFLPTIRLVGEHVERKKPTKTSKEKKEKLSNKFE